MTRRMAMVFSRGPTASNTMANGKMASETAKEHSFILMRADLLEISEKIKLKKEVF